MSITQVIQNPVAAAERMVGNRRTGLALVFILLGITAGFAFSQAAVYLSGYHSVSNGILTNVFALLAGIAAELMKIVSMFIVSGLCFKSGITLSQVVCLMGVNQAACAATFLIMSPTLPLLGLAAASLTSYPTLVGMVLMSLTYYYVIDLPVSKRLYSLICFAFASQFLQELALRLLQSVYL